MDEQKIKILEGAIKAFNNKGLKFTMDDLAKILGMSKKTIYKFYRDKEEMFSAMVDYTFAKIKESENVVLNDNTLPIEEKIKNVLGVLPDSYREINLEQIYLLKGKYPEIYKKVEEHIESGWEDSIALINKGIEEKKIRPINVALFKTMFEATLEQFFQRDVLVKNNIAYSDALEEIVGILVNGIVIND